MNRIEMKEYAKERCIGNRWLLLKALLIIALCESVVQLILINLGFNERNSILINIFSTLLISPLSFGLVDYFVAFEKENDTDLSLIFEPYKFIIKLFVLNMFVYIVTMLGYILLFVPGLILTFSYAMVPYLFKEHSDLSIIELMKFSRTLMYGHKMDYFVLMLSFLGWAVLCGFTLGIALIWVAPYYQVTITKFFVNILEENENSL